MDMNSYSTILDLDHGGESLPTRIPTAARTGLAKTERDRRTRAVGTAAPGPFPVVPARVSTAIVVSDPDRRLRRVVFVVIIVDTVFIVILLLPPSPRRIAIIVRSLYYIININYFTVVGRGRDRPSRAKFKRDLRKPARTTCLPPARLLPARRL